ncbi:MAG TPA: AI-2E family transporter [Candidatus Binatia bacterium]|nr:AI-2E family transporter [Candidatus Binatia bacterium]
MSQVTEPVATAAPQAAPAAEPARSPTPGAHPPASRREARPVVRLRTLVAAALLTLAVVGLIVLLAQVFGLVLDFLIAVVIAEGIRPPVQRLQDLHLPRMVAIFAVYVGLLVLVTLVVTLLVQPVVSEATSLAGHFHQYQTNAVNLIGSVEKHLGITNTQLGSQVEGLLGQAGQYLLAIGGTIAGAVGSLILVLVITFLWLTTAGRLKSFVVDLFPPRAQPLASDVLREIGFRMGGYVRAVAINMVVVGIVTGGACALLGLPSPVLLGIFAGITAAIPMIGPFLGGIPPVLLGFTVSPGFALLVLAVIVVIQLVDQNTIVPVMMGRVLALPALAVVVALLVGWALAGVLGALLAIPIAAAIQVLIARVLVPYIHHTQGRADPAYVAAFGEPAGDGSEPSPHDR